MFEKVVAAAVSAIDFAFANPILMLLGLFGLFVGFFLLVMLPFGIGSTFLAGESDPGFFVPWLVGLAFLAGVLLVIALLVGFVRFVWYAWA